MEDAGQEEEDITPIQGLILALKDYKLWMVVGGQICVQAIASLTNFLPTLVKNFGYGTIKSLLLTAPPYCLAAFFCLFNTWYSDRNNVRSPHMIFPMIVVLAGIVITLATPNVPANYVALMLMIPGTYGCFQISNAWAASVSPRPKLKRAVALALNNSLGNTALIWTPYLYPKSQGPRYRTAWIVNLSLCVLCIVLSVALRLVLQRANKKVDYQIAQIHADPVTIGKNGEIVESEDIAKLEEQKGGHLRGRNEGLLYRYQI